MKRADIAMYRAKALGKARHQIFDRSMHREAVARAELENDLRHAIEQGLGRIDGVVEAHVNFATGRATVEHDDAIDLARFRATIESLGYSAPEVEDREAAHALVNHG